MGFSIYQRFDFISTTSLKQLEAFFQENFDVRGLQTRKLEEIREEIERNTNGTSVWKC